MEGGTVALLGELASLAAKAGVILHRVTPQDPNNLETMRQLGLEIDVEGTYAQILVFLQGVEARPETIWIPRVEMKPSQEAGANVQCALSVVVFADNRGNSG
jgi:Tfp pilus assembly protein PilO